MDPGHASAHARDADAAQAPLADPVERLRAVWEAAAAMHAAPTTQAALDVVTSRFAEHVDARAAALVLPDEHLGGPALRHWCGVHEERDIGTLAAVARRLDRAPLPSFTMPVGGGLAVGSPVVARGVVRGALFGLLDPAHERTSPLVEETARSYALLAGICVAGGDDLGPLREAASHDALTGCLNRRAILEILAEEVARSERHGHGLTCCMIDLDGFKLVNDRHGHLEGDRALVHVGAALRRGVRIYDCVGRYGGDEFLVVMPETVAEVGAAVARRLVAAVAEAGEALGHPLGASAGVAGWARGGPLERIVRDADDALLAAKVSAPGTVVVARHPTDM